MQRFLPYYGNIYFQIPGNQYIPGLSAYPVFYGYF